MAGHLASSETSSISQAQLFAGDGPVKTKADTFASGLDLDANTVVARNTTTGNIVAWDVDGTNGTNVAVGITCEAVDTTGGAAVHNYYFMGDFNIDALVWDEDATDAQKAAAFDRTAIKVRKLL